MAKRSAASELTDRNWDHEDEAEDAGEFTKASEATIKGRQIIKAKRRNPGDGQEGKSAFSGFGGFSFKPTQTSTPLVSGFFKSDTAATSSIKTTPFKEVGGFFKSDTAATSSLIKTTPFKEEESSNRIESTSPSKRQKADSTQSTSSQQPTPQPTQHTNNGKGSPGISPERTVYLSSLKALNMSVLDWISQHLDKNPYCILTPIFKDYSNHLEQLEAKEDKESTGTNGNAVTTTVTPTTKKEESVNKPMEEEKPFAPKSGLTFGMGSLQTKTESTSGFGGFGFKPSVPASTGMAAPASSIPSAGFGFNIGSTSSNLLNSASASSSGVSGFSFAIGSSAGPSTSTGSHGTEDEEYVPPIAETVEHKEEGSVCSKKCKLFYQKDGAWAEKGVGFLHLKKTDDMAQLIVRADNTLGNILLNIRLSESMPLSRQGKNNVSMMCIPNPAIPNVPSDKPVPMLIRVKSGDDADELVDKMKEISS